MSSYNLALYHAEYVERGPVYLFYNSLPVVYNKAFRKGLYNVFKTVPLALYIFGLHKPVRYVLKNSVGREFPYPERTVYHLIFKMEYKGSHNGTAVCKFYELGPLLAVFKQLHKRYSHSAVCAVETEFLRAVPVHIQYCSFIVQFEFDKSGLKHIEGFFKPLQLVFYPFCDIFMKKAYYIGLGNYPV